MRRRVRHPRRLFHSYWRHRNTLSLSRVHEISVWCIISVSAPAKTVNIPLCIYIVVYIHTDTRHTAEQRGGEVGVRAVGRPSVFIMKYKYTVHTFRPASRVSHRDLLLHPWNIYAEYVPCNGLQQQQPLCLAEMRFYSATNVRIYARRRDDATPRIKDCKNVTQDTFYGPSRSGNRGENLCKHRDEI